MTVCAVYNCKSNNDKRLKRNANGLGEQINFYRFPRDKVFVKIWIQKCGRKDKINVKNSYICSKHFTSEHYLRNLQHELLNYSPKNARKLNPDAIPTENIPSSSTVTNEHLKKINAQRLERIDKRNRKALIDELINTTEDCNETFENIKKIQNNKNLVNIENLEKIGNREISGNMENCINIEGLSDLSPYNNVEEISTEHQITINEFLPMTTEVIQDKYLNSENLSCCFVESHMYLEKTVDTLKKQNKLLLTKCYRLQQENKIISKIFSEIQRKKMQNCRTRTKWTVDDITRSIAIYSSGPKAYRFLLTKGYLLPSVNTLKKWSAIHKNAVCNRKQQKNLELM